MLNYIWLSLIGIGIIVALSTDMRDASTNRYHNGEPVPAALKLDTPVDGPLQQGQSYPCTLEIPSDYLAQHYGIVSSAPLVQHAVLVPSGKGQGTVKISLDDRTPQPWKDIFQATKSVDYLQAKATFGVTAREVVPAIISFDQIRFVKLNAVANDGILKSAKTAVELAIGLIGIMALWLGVMKIAEQAGLIAALGRLLKPITSRLFPDVPHDHPAMGAMIMNISANMLGLSNAATPFGLKAMEELNKLNPKAGTATDAMCTFLVINTGNVQLIPATAIAIRAAAGSANPAEIIGPAIAASFVSLIVGITVVKIFSKLPVYRKQMEA